MIQALLVLLAVVSCEPTTSPTSTTVPVLDPPDAFGPVTPNSTSVPTTLPTDDTPPGVHLGSLPNGADFVAHAPGIAVQTPASVGGNFFYDPRGGEPIPAGEVRYQRVQTPPPAEYGGGLLRLSSSSWLVEIFFSPDVVGDLGSLAETVITRSVLLEERNGWPVLHVAGPFTWEHSGAEPPTVDYGSFRLETGCTSEAVSCSETGAVQVLVAASDDSSQPETSGREGIFVESSAPRSSLNPHFLDPGPLEERNGADLLWTGAEMIVWGGRTDLGGVPTLIDGAAFDPATDTWRMLAESPLKNPAPNRAVWTGDEMVVVSPDGTYAYDPSGDSWRAVSGGIIPSEWPGRMVFADDRIYVWALSRQVHALDLETGDWIQIPAPSGLNPASQYDGVLRTSEDDVIAVVRQGVCEGKSFQRLTGEDWQPLSPTTLATAEFADCSTANQSAYVSNELYIWEDDNHPTMAYSSFSDEWRMLVPIPLEGSEGGSGPVAMDGDHFMVPRSGEGAVFDANSDDPIQDGTWTLIHLPGVGTDAEIIWTGEEFLAWGIWGSFDAWRWAPPDGVVIGGDDAN